MGARPIDFNVLGIVRTGWAPVRATTGVVDFPRGAVHFGWRGAPTVCRGEEHGGSNVAGKLRQVLRKSNHESDSAALLTKRPGSADPQEQVTRVGRARIGRKLDPARTG